MDDALGGAEAVRSGGYEGVVERVSLGSVELRHRRRPLFTLPFGSPGEIRNEARDRVVDTNTVGVVDDTDLDEAKTITERIAGEPAEIEEFEPPVIQTLETQGVDPFGDVAIQLGMKT